MIVPEFSSIAILAASIADSFGASFRKRWRLVNNDWEFTAGDDRINMAVEVEAQSDTDQIQLGYSTAITTSGGFGDASMGTQPGQNSPDSVTISAVFNAEHATDDIRPKLDALRALRKYDVNLNRVPLVRFEYNDQVILCWMSNLSISMNGTFPISGLPISANVSITLTEAVERPLDSQRQGTEKSTFYHILRAGETFETLAARYLGNPRLSVHIRRTNPGVIEEESASVKILPRMHSEMRKEVKFYAPCVSADGWEDVYETIAEERL
jgi:hypothetical protein